MPKIQEAGTYHVAVKQTALGESKNTKGMQIVVTFADIVNGDTITAYFPCSERAWQYTEEKLRTMGWDAAAAGYQFEELNLDPSPIAGNEVEIVCDFEEYQGERNLRVKFVNPVGGGFKRMDENEAASFADRLRQQIGVTGVSGRRLPRQPQPNGATGSKVPF